MISKVARNARPHVRPIRMKPNRLSGCGVLLRRIRHPIITSPLTGTSNSAGDLLSTARPAAAPDKANQLQLFPPRLAAPAERIQTESASSESVANVAHSPST